MVQLVDLSGHKYGRLTVIGRSENNKYGRTRWFCKCDCGKDTVAEGIKIRSGHTSSCGCYGKEQRLKAVTKYERNFKAECRAVYATWKGMRKRCYNKNDPKYPSYGARGIKVCPRWHDFLNFYKDMGLKPSLDHSLDRINNDGDYEPGNCRWAKRTEQARNRVSNIYIVCDGEVRTLLEWADELGIDGSELARMIRRREWPKKELSH